MKILVLAGVLMLQGCGAVYKYHHTIDGTCDLYIYSFREVQHAAIDIKSDCSIKSGAEELTTNTEALQAIKQIVSKLP